MTIDEFLNLKEGDRIDNPMTRTTGAVVGVLHNRRGEPDGVSIQWDGTAPDMARQFRAQTTAWMHWTRHEPAASFMPL